MKSNTKEKTVDPGHRDAKAPATGSHPVRYRLHGEHTDILGESPEIIEVLKKIEGVADTNAAVLIQGETGTGKELIAYALHRNSSRSAREWTLQTLASLDGDRTKTAQALGMSLSSLYNKLNRYTAAPKL